MYKLWGLQRQPRLQLDTWSREARVINGWFLYFSLSLLTMADLMSKRARDNTVTELVHHCTRPNPDIIATLVKGHGQVGSALSAMSLWYRGQIKDLGVPLKWLAAPSWWRGCSTSPHHRKSGCGSALPLAITRLLGPKQLRQLHWITVASAQSHPVLCVAQTVCQCFRCVKAS